MTAGEWVRLRLVEFGAALCAASILVGGLTLGVPFLRARAGEVLIYGFCCTAAVVVHSTLDLLARACLRLARLVRRAPRPQPAVEAS